LPQGEIQSVEASCFVHATEDEVRLKDLLGEFLGAEEGPSEERLEGHYGNVIVHLTWHLTGEAAGRVFGRLVEAMGDEGRKVVLADLGAHTDEHGALYVRLNKQALFRGQTVFSSSDPVRVRVKPRSFLMKGDPQRFYRRFLEERSR
jgi:RNA binding exosome subunit